MAKVVLTLTLTLTPHLLALTLTLTLPLTLTLTSSPPHLLTFQIPRPVAMCLGKVAALSGQVLAALVQDQKLLLVKTGEGKVRGESEGEGEMRRWG